MICISAPFQEEGTGARVRRLFPSPQLRWPTTDPFLLLDEFFLNAHAGFPDHPHRGFEIITYLLEGGVEHRDSLGNRIQAPQGYAMHFVTGSGVIHSEFPIGNAHGLQLWINLPRALKQFPPSLRLIKPDEMPILPIEGGMLRTIASTTGPIHTHTELTYHDITFIQAGSHTWNIPSDSVAFAYILDGEPAINNTITTAGQLCLVADQVMTLRTDTAARAVVLHGKRQHEVVRFFGPFVD